MKLIRKTTSLFLALCLIVSILAVGIVPAAADSTVETYAQEKVQGSNILHCFDWSYNAIKANMEDIAKAGYTAVQTSPVQPPKDYNASWTNTGDNWWKLYQPLDLKVANGNTWLGTKAQLTAMCAEAEKYDIKVIVDIVSNHLANNNNDGGTYSYLNSGVASDMKNPDYFREDSIAREWIDWGSDDRFNVTQRHMGMPELKTQHPYVQQKALGLLTECIDCGVDGFRFDTAKHIELPNESDSQHGTFGGDFWPTVINGAKDYASENNFEEPFFYGEILGYAGTDISNYTQYMAVTDNETGNNALNYAHRGSASRLANSGYVKGAGAAKSVLWAESHDTYMHNESTYADNNDINKAWAILGARSNSSALFFARPSTMGAASTDTNWKSKEVAEVNKFKSHFVGASEYLASSGNTAYIERGSKGVVIAKLDGAGAVNLTANQMSSGTYTDQVSGSTFTVANGRISGTVGSTGVAVVYDPTDEAYDYITASTLYFKPADNGVDGKDWIQGNERYAMYVYNGITDHNAWVSMTSVGDGYYSAAVPAGNWTNVIFCRMNGASQENKWDNMWDQTANLFPDEGKDCYLISSNSWSLYGAPCEHTYGAPVWTWANDHSSATATITCSICGDVLTATDSAPVTEVDGDVTTYTASVTLNGTSYTNSVTIGGSGSGSGGDSDTYTVYAINNANWNNMKVYWYGSSGTNPSWSGVEMNSFSGTKVYTFDVPTDVTAIIFNNGSGQQTDNINNSDISDGAVWIINGDRNYTKAPDYYLVGSEKGWSTQNNPYVFSISANGEGKVEYKLSGVELDEGEEFKVAGSDNSWYPGGSDNNYSVASSGTYDIYFRPNGDGNSDWYSGGISGKYYFCLSDVSPRNITWQDEDGNILATGTVPNGSTPSYHGETPTKESTEQYSYTFDGWDPTPAPVTEDTTYTAQFTEALRTYTITWKNYDGSTIKTDTVNYGSHPSYSGATPTKPNDGDTAYTFDFWFPEFNQDTVITGDTTYTARFTENTTSYTIRWENSDGTLIKEEEVAEGRKPQYTGEIPTKAADAQYTYTFSGWSPAIREAYDDAVYTAQYDTTLKKYTIQFKNYDGSVLQSSEVEYGTVPAYTGETPTKPSTLEKAYTFSGWNTTPVAVTEAATYTAQFTEAAIDTIDISAINFIGWDDVYVYYWLDGENNTWPGSKMTPDADGLVYTASIPVSAEAIIFNNGDTEHMKQTANITSGIVDDARWAIHSSTEDEDVHVHTVPTYKLLGTMNNWKAADAPSFTPVQNDDGLEEYKVTATLSENDAFKAYGSDDSWFPGGMVNYQVTDAGTYDIFFRPNADGSSDWLENVLFAQHAHNLTAHPAVTANCTAAGNSAYWSCSECGKFFSDENGETEIAENSWIIPKTAHTLTPHAAVTATCTAAGNSAYWSCSECGKFFSDENGETEIAENSWVIPKTAHTLTPHAAVAATCTAAGNSAYWSCSECGKFFSDENGETEIAENSWIIPIDSTAHHLTEHPAKAPTKSEAGNTAYWSCDLCGKYFSDANGENEIAENSWIIPAISSAFAKHSLTLNGDIGVNFYLNLTDEELTQGATVSFALNGEAQSEYTIAPDRDRYEINGMTLYKATCNVCAPEMADTITAALAIDGTVVESEDYSVKAYGDKFLSAEYKEAYIEKGGTEAEYNKLADLVQTMLNYGAATQEQFATEHPNNTQTHSAENLANSDIDYDLVPLTAAELSAINMPAPDKDAINSQLSGTGLTYYGYTMLLHSKTILRFYFQKETPDTDISGITLNGNTAKNYNDYFAYVEVEGIPAYELNNSYTLIVNGTTLGSYSALTYIKDVLENSPEDTTLCNTVTAMYRYHEAAVAYFPNNG